MTGREMQYRFQFLCGDVYPLSEEVFYWINFAINAMVRKAFSKENQNYDFEINQKLINDLQTLVQTATNSSSTSGGTNKYNFTLPGDYWFTVNERCGYSYTDCNSAAQTGEEDVINAHMNNMNAILEDPYSEHILRFGKAKPIRLLFNDTVQLISDGNYTPTSHILYYIARYTTVTRSNSSDLPEETHEDVVRIAYELYSANEMKKRQVGSGQLAEDPQQINN